MPKEEWGVKRVCPKCSVRFYDLRRDPATCPSCGHSFSLDSLNGGTARPLVDDKSKSKKKAAAEPEIESGEEVLDEGDVQLEDDVLDDEDDDNVSLDDIADVSSDEDES